MKNRNNYWLNKLALALLLAAAALLPQSALATTRTVSNLNDAGAGSLRDTIAASVAGDTVTFASGLTGTINLSSGELTIARDLTIIGPGSATLTLKGVFGSRIFRIISTTANLSGMTVTGGFVSNEGGGGIMNAAALGLRDCVVSGNIAPSSAAGGGGVFNTGSLTASNCTFAGNNAFKGGGILNSGTLTLNNCTVSGNRTGDPNNNNSVDTSGAGIFNSSGTLTITNCTVSGNVAVASGGGIYNAGTLSIISSTIAGNATYVHDGAGVYNSGTLSLRNSTISANLVNNFGAGLYHGAGTANIENTLIAGNSTNSFAPPFAPFGMDVYGNITSQGHNFIGKTNASSGWVATDLTGSAASPLNPLLGPLQNNGGPTPTMVPTPLSAAIDAGDDAALGPPLNLTTDQRGFPRKLGLHIDIGAAEADQAPAGADFVVTTTDDHNDGVAGTVDCTLREAIIAANAGADANTITFASNVTGVITLRLGELAITNDVTIVGPGAMVLAVNGNRSSRVFNLSGGTVFISGLAITNGHVTGAVGRTGSVPGAPGWPGGAALGGGIYSQSILTVSNCWITGNSVVGGNGGAGGADDFNSQAGTGGVGGTGAGGGIYSSSELTLANCTISGNTAAGGGGGLGPDAASYFFGDAGLGGAAGGGSGGGVANGGNLNINNCTLAGNSAKGGAGGAGGTAQQGGGGGAGGSGGDAGGGGLANLSKLRLASCTLSSNAVTSGPGGLGGLGSGGGVDGATGPPGTAQGGGLQSTGALISIQNSLLAGNSALSGPDCAGAFTSQGYNFIGDASGATGFTGAGDQTGARGSPLDPLLGPLQFNGGPAPTMALLSGSPVIDKGNRGVLVADQRSVSRPFDFPGISNGRGGDGSDIGAFELSPSALGIVRSVNNVILSWSIDDAGYTLEARTDLNSPFTWSAVPGNPAIVGSQYTVTNSAVAGNKFYRLRK